MGVLDMAKMVRKAQKAKSTMQSITVAGRSKSGMTAMLVNGLNEILEISFEPELLESPSPKQLEREVIEAYNDAKKELEKQLAQTMDIDSLRDMLAA